MKAYFSLQYNLINRKLRELGLAPFVGYTLGLLAFIFVAMLLFYKTIHAKHILIIGCIPFLTPLSEKKRRDFLLPVFGEKKYKILRIVENFIISLPFTLFLLYKSEFLAAVFLLVIAAAMAIFSIRIPYKSTVPPPFSKRPFEAIMGFRKVFFMFLLAYALTVIGITVDNFNLGLFSLFLIFLISLTFFGIPEKSYFVWIHEDDPSSFLKRKLKNSCINTSILALPSLTVLMVFFPYNYLWILLCFVVGLLYVCLVVLSKYAAYPNELNFPQALILTLGLFIPLLAIILIPIYHKKSILKLKMILNDKN